MPIVYAAQQQSVQPCILRPAQCHSACQSQGSAMVCPCQVHADRCGQAERATAGNAQAVETQSRNAERGKANNAHDKITRCPHRLAPSRTHRKRRAAQCGFLVRRMNACVDLTKLPKAVAACSQLSATPLGHSSRPQPSPYAAVAPSRCLCVVLLLAATVPRMSVALRGIGPTDSGQPCRRGCGGVCVLGKWDDQCTREHMQRTPAC